MDQWPNEPTKSYLELAGWFNLTKAWRNAMRGKRSAPNVARFDFRAETHLAGLRQALLSGEYSPRHYVTFQIKHPKARTISAAHLIDRVLQHALCQIIEPRFEPHFIANSYANRKGKGSHAAIDAFQAMARRHKYVMRMDIQQHFASIDHEVLRDILQRRIVEPDLMALIDTILSSGEGLAGDTANGGFFPGDDLLSLCRNRGLPIGNLTSQFWSNCYLHPLDQFITRELGCQSYVRYVDDFALFGNDKRQLLDWRFATMERLNRLRLLIHDRQAHALPVVAGVPWLGFVVYPTHRRIKARKVRTSHRYLRRLLADYHAGHGSFATLDASIQGWLNHLGHGDTWRLREAVLSELIVNPARHQRAVNGLSGTDNASR